MSNHRFKHLAALIVLCLTSLLTSHTPLGARAATSEIYGVVVSVNGATSSSRGISFYSSARLSDSTALVRPQGSTSWEDALRFTGEGSVHNFQIDNSLVRQDYYIHKVVVSGLNANTTYEYKVGSATANVWSAQGTFTTSDPTSTQTSFMVTTDVHYGASEKPGYRFYENAIKSAYVHDPSLDFLVMTGDIVNQWSDELYTYVYKEAEWVDAYANPYLKDTTFVHSAGNHDINEHNSDFDYSLFNHYALAPAAGLETKHGVTYSYDYANAHFVVWNNPDTDYKYSEAQLAWLDADLAATNKAWKLLFTHVPLYEGQLNYQSDVLTILEKHHVDIVFAGHRHYYMRTKPMQNGKATAQVTINESSGFVKRIYTLENEGTVHTTNSSTGGASAWRIHNGALSSNTANYFGLNSTLPGVGTVEHGNGMYSIVTINDNELSVDVYFRSTTSPEAPFKLLESYGNRKDYYKSLNRALDDVPAHNALGADDLEALLKLEQNIHKYQSAFPELALNISSAKLTKLSETIHYLTNPPVAGEEPVKGRHTTLYISVGVLVVALSAAGFISYKLITKRRKPSLQ